MLEGWEKVRQLFDWEEFSSNWQHEMMRKVERPMCGSNQINRRKWKKSNWNIVPFLTFHINNKNFVAQTFPYILHRKKFGWDVWLFFACHLVKAVEMSPLLRNDETFAWLRLWIQTSSMFDLHLNTSLTKHAPTTNQTALVHSVAASTRTSNT